MVDKSKKSPHKGINALKHTQTGTVYGEWLKREERDAAKKAKLYQGARGQDGRIDPVRLNKAEVFLNFSSDNNAHKIVYIGPVAYLLTFEDDLVMVDKIKDRVPSGIILRELVLGNSIARYIIPEEVVLLADIPLLA